MNKYDFDLYRMALVVFFGFIFGLLLFEIGKEMPAYTFTAGAWLTGLGLSSVPAWLGYRMGRAAERASTGGGNA